jgi:hypothetical protein
VATFEIGKILPLTQRELQRLGSLRRSWPDEAAVASGGGQRPNLLSSFLSLVDIDKRADVDSMPFQPLFSPLRRPAYDAAAASAAAGAPAAQSPAAGGGEGEWGELLGWWADEANGAETFEVELRRPVGLDAVQVPGPARLGLVRFALSRRHQPRPSGD